ncbi:hypothetical protein HYY75_08975, partial [bacterium]|nr:hypothetical protein [bacterium]
MLRFARLSGIFLFCLLSLSVWLFFGCGGGGGDSGIPIQTQGRINGNVTASGTIGASINSISESILQAVNVSNCEVYLESNRLISTKTDSSGLFSLTSVPFGAHRLIGLFKKVDGTTYKVRSATDISLSENTPEVQAPAMDLALANRQVRGILKNSQGNPIPNGTLSIWGETFTTDSTGNYSAPPMPDGVTGNIQIQTTGYQTASLSVSFTSPNPPYIETTLAPTGSTNRAPVVTLAADKTTVSALGTVNFSATAVDPDNNTLTYYWYAYSGQIATSGGNLSAIFTAPSTSGVATISFEARDPQGLSGKMYIGITVGTGGTTNNAPTVTVVSTASTVLISSVLALTANATDSDGDALTYSWQSTNGTLFSNNTQSVNWLAPNVATSSSISVQVSDGRGGSASYSKSITVSTTPPITNYPPTASISYPLNSELIATGVVFIKGYGTDTEDGLLDISKNTWYLNGSVIASQIGQFYYPFPSPGTFTLRLDVVDSQGASGTLSIQFRMNAVPNVVTISAPSANSIFLASSTVTFSGSASDIEDGVLTGSNLQWWEGTSMLGSGISYATNSLKLGSHTVVLKAIDQKGQYSQTSVTIGINKPPTILLASPTTFTFAYAAPINFVASVTDYEDGIIPAAQIGWYENTTWLATGTSFSKSDFSAGSHVLTLWAFDSRQAVSSYTFSVTVSGNNSPSVTRISPASGSIYNFAAPITFTASATDVEDGPIASTKIGWLDGISFMGTGSTVIVSNLSAATHSITIYAIDSQNAVGTLTFNVSVLPNNLPTFSSISPASNSQYNFAAPITFAATATDVEEGVIPSNQIGWYEGGTWLATGSSFVKSNFSAATHSVTVLAVDSQNGVGATTFNVGVRQNYLPTFTLNSPAPITFNASATDVEDGTISSSQIGWYEGGTWLATGSSFVKSNFTAATHSITLLAVDSQSGVGSITFDVGVKTNNVPTCTISGPASGTVYLTGSNVTFTGTVTDVEDGSIATASKMGWSSSIDGFLASGSPYSTTALTGGNHVITFSGIDSQNAVGATTTAIVIN